MSKKYHSAASPSIITNDLFLAAFLSTVGCTLDRIEKNERRRVSFVFMGDRCRELREAYRTGPVHVDMRTFRENLNELRDRVGRMVTEYASTKLSNHHPEERSAAHASTRLCTSEHAAGKLTRLSTYAHA